MLERPSLFIFSRVLLADTMKIQVNIIFRSILYNHKISLLFLLNTLEGHSCNVAFFHREISVLTTGYFVTGWNWLFILYWWATVSVDYLFVPVLSPLPPHHWKHYILNSSVTQLMFPLLMLMNKIRYTQLTIQVHWERHSTFTMNNIDQSKAMQFNQHPLLSHTRKPFTQSKLLRNQFGK